MELRKLGIQGPSVSLLGLGCNNFGRRIGFEDSVPVVEKALEVGVNFFDTADTYGEGLSEEWLGRILGPRRKSVIIATKFGMSMPAGSGASPRYVARAAEASLKRLGTDWIDLYQLHRPDPATPIEDTLGAMDKLVRDGKVRQIGCTYLDGAEYLAARAAAERKKLHPFTTCQNEYNLLVRGIERDLVPAIEKTGAGFMPYLPLAGGFLTGKYRRGADLPKDSRFAKVRWQAGQVMSERNWRMLAKLEEFCAARGRSLIELAMSWLAQRPFVTTIIAGATKAEQVEGNLRALSWKLSAEELAEIDRLTLTP
ncbi:MAG TPA: aldo/keto reductase [Stellaceae bacterium]|nr:aldo/keto reductase [Stellaceae bacterium]